MQSEHESGNAKNSPVSSSSSPASSFDDNREKGVVVKGKGRCSPLMLPESSPHMNEWSMISASPRSGPAPYASSDLYSQSPDWSMQSPPIQKMGQPVSDYDPNRIPSSVFSSRQNTEWSAASNESLFSIHMGNNSFSGDQGLQFIKGEEPAKLDELSKLNNPPSSLPPVMEVGPEDQRNSASTEASHKMSSAAMKEAEVACFSTSASSISEVRGLASTDAARISASTPRLSDESGNSGSSFAFPLLTGDAGRNAAAKPGPNSSELKPVKESEPHPEPQQQPKEVSSNGPPRRWFSCFSCCSTCW